MLSNCCFCFIRNVQLHYTEKVSKYTHLGSYQQILVSPCGQKSLQVGSLFQVVQPVLMSAIFLEHL